MENKDNNVEENWRQVMEEFGSDEEKAEQSQQEPQQYTGQQIPQPQQYTGQQIPQQQYTGQQIPQQQYTGQQIPQPQQYAGQQIPQQQYTGQQIPQQQYAGQQFNQQQNGIPAYEASSFAVMPIKKKSKAPLIILIIILAAALICGGVFLLFRFFRGSSYEKLEREFFAGIGSTLEQNPVTGQASDSDEIARQFTLTLDMGQQQGFAPSVITGNIYEDAKNGSSKAEVKFMADGEAYLTINAWSENDRLVIQIPELTDKYITGGSTDSAASLTSAVIALPLSADDYAYDDGFDDGYSAADGILSALESINQDTLDKIISIVSDAYFDNFTGDDIKSATVKAGSKTINCSSVTVTFTNEKLMQFLTDLIDGIKSDSEILSLAEMCGIDKDTLAMIQSSAESYLEDEDGDEELGRMIVYYTDGEIIGRDIYIGGEPLIKAVHAFNDDGMAFSLSSGDTESGFDFYLNADKSGDDYALSSSMTVDGENVLTMSGNFTVTDNSFTGTADVVTPDNGTFKTDISASESGDGMAFDLNISNDGSTVMGIKTDVKNIPYQKPEMPETNASNSVSIDDPAQAEKFADEIYENCQKLSDKLESLKNPDIFSQFFVAAIKDAVSDDMPDDMTDYMPDDIPGDADVTAGSVSVSSRFDI